MLGAPRGEGFTIGFETLPHKDGSDSSLPSFKNKILELARANNLPEISLKVIGADTHRPKLKMVMRKFLEDQSAKAGRVADFMAYFYSRFVCGPKDGDAHDRSRGRAGRTHSGGGTSPVQLDAPISRPIRKTRCSLDKIYRSGIVCFCAASRIQNLPIGKYFLMDAIRQHIFPLGKIEPTFEECR
jgi:hypothetical protein